MNNSGERRCWRYQGMEIGQIGPRSASSPTIGSVESRRPPTRSQGSGGKYNDCKRVLDLCRKRQDINKHGMDVCLNGIGVGAGVICTAFQIASVGLAVAACTILSCSLPLLSQKHSNVESKCVFYVPRASERRAVLVIYAPSSFPHVLP